MSFEPYLREIVEGCGGGIAAALMQSDGVPIEEVTLDVDGLVEDVATAGAEFGRILAEIRKASDGISGGSLLESTVCLSQVTLVFRAVDDETFLVVALAPDGNLGKARYLMRRQLLPLRQLL